MTGRSMAEIPRQQRKTGGDLRVDVASLVPVEGPTRFVLKDVPSKLAGCYFGGCACASVRDGEEVMSNTVMYLSQRMHEWH